MDWEHIIKYIDEHKEEIFFLTFVGIIGIRADYLLMKIEEILRKRLPIPAKERFAKAATNPCICKHDVSHHYFRSIATNGKSGCYICRICKGFVTPGAYPIEGEKTSVV